MALLTELDTRQASPQRSGNLNVRDYVYFVPKAFARLVADAGAALYHRRVSPRSRQSAGPPGSRPPALRRLRLRAASRERSRGRRHPIGPAEGAARDHLLLAGVACANRLGR